MENKSNLKFYLLGAIALVVVIIIIVFSIGNSKSAGQRTQTVDNAKTPLSNAPVTTSTPPASNTPDTTDTSITPDATNSPAAAAVKPTSAPSDSLVGTWVSSVQGKGMQGSGERTIQGTTTEIILNGDVDLVIEKVENNTGTGKITFNNVCLTETISVAGKPDVIKPAQCLSTYSQPAVMQIAGNTINYTGKSFLGASISLTGTYTNDTMSGIFQRTSSTGTIDGTFNLGRTEN